MSLIERTCRDSNIVRYLPKFEVVICTECHYVLNKSPGISRHLTSVHSWSPAEAKAVDQQFIDKVMRSPGLPNCTWIFPKPEDPSIPYLSLHDDGYGCHICEFTCRVKGSITTHYSIHHRDEVHSKP